MTTEGNSDEEDTTRRNYAAPYNSNHPVPTVQKYREHREELDNQQKQEEVTYDNDEEGRLEQALSSVKKVFVGQDNKHAPGNPYPAENRNDAAATQRQEQSSPDPPSAPAKDKHYVPRAPKQQENSGHDAQENEGPNEQQREPKKFPQKKGSSGPSATEINAGIVDPKQKRKNIKKMKRNDGGREVTDPVTHLPVIIYDSTNKRLEKAPENEPASGSEPRSATGLSGAQKSESQIDLETHQLHGAHAGMLKNFPPPDFDDTQAELKRVYQFALIIGLTSIITLATLVLVLWQLLILTRDASISGSSVRLFIPICITVVFSTLIGFSIVWAVQGWLGKKVEEIWQDEIWDAAREQETTEIESRSLPESTQWLNSLLASVWPLINPDLFTSLSDMLEDVMQASLPKMVRMVSVNDLGQGSESFRILGVKWLPTGAASQSVDARGNLKSPKSQETSDRADPGEGEVEDEEKSDEVDKASSGEKNDPKKQQDQKQKQQEQESMAEGFEAEQGDFVNLEIALAYRARSSGKSLKLKAKNAHLFLKFYLLGSIALPVWVELRGLIMTMRMRLQLTPDPPFFALATITFLGQPKASLSCVPLNRHALNLMDVPLISSFVQSSIDAALAEYVAPKSLTLDLKDMLMGDDFKKDTVSRGVVVIYVKSARDFKEGDAGLGPLKKGSSDGYVTTGWAKFAKPVSSTRIILSDMCPTWNEWSYLLVTAEELNADERVRLQLWDSDRTDADDDLGRVEVGLKDLMHNPKTKGQMCDREDRLVGENEEEKMPGTLKWSVGYFGKTRITTEQLAQQSAEPDIRSKADLQRSVDGAAGRKLRESTEHDESEELKQQRVKDYKAREDSLIISSRPPHDYPSGILSIQIHNITGLELERLRKNRSEGDGKADAEDEAEEADDLPSSYCTIILDHQKIYKTRTKPKNAKPFFNAGAERFVRDWRTSEIIISVRDARVHENDPLVGIIYLPLAKLFQKRSQIMGTFPLAGGIGFGSARISAVFRSIELLAPKELLGWDYGTLEIKSPVKVKGSLPDDTQKLRIKLQTSISRAKMQAANGEWSPKRGRKQVFLAVRKRYSTPLVIEFRKSTLGPDSTSAFGVFWLAGIPDEEERTITIPVWKGGKENFKHATSCCEYHGLHEGEKPLGEIEVTMKLWRGLSGYHQSFSKQAKQRDLRDVMEVLDAANESNEGRGSEHGETDSSDSEGDDDRDQDGRPPGPSSESKDLENSPADTNFQGTPHGILNKAKVLVDGHNDSNNGERGPLSELRDYKDHRKQLHRRHRGLMQFKATRTLDWLATKVRHGEGHLSDMVGRREREPGVETEA